MKGTRDIAKGEGRGPLLEEIERLRAANAAMSRQIEVLSADNEALAAQGAAAEEDRAALAAQLKRALAEIERLVERVRVENARRWGARSDRILPHQISLFNDVEAAAAAGPAGAGAGKPGRKARKRRRPIDWSRFETEVVDHTADASCPSCGSAMEPMGYEVRRELKYVPARLVAVEHRVWKYVCRPCSRANAAGADEDVAVSIVRAAGPLLPLGKSHAGASLIAHVIHQKYRLSMPINRIWSDMSSQQGLPDSRQAVAGWVIDACGRWLARLCSLMREELLGKDIIHIDETPVICMEESRRKRARGSTKSYMWLFCSAECDVPIYLFRFGPSRKKEVASAVLSGWRGTIVTDAYGAYRDFAPGVSRVACAAHIRRRFTDIAKACAPGEARRSAAAEAVARLDAIFAADRAIRERCGGDYAAVAAARAAELGPMMDSFHAWAVETRASYAAPRMQLAAALDYAIDNWGDLRNALSDGRLPLTNNRAERGLRTFCCGRKNWLFSDTTRGADASACAYSVVATAAANGLDDAKYLEWVLSEMPRAEADGALEERLPELLPWSASVPERCRALSREDVFKDDPLVAVDPAAFDHD